MNPSRLAFPFALAAAAAAGALLAVLLLDRSVEAQGSASAGGRYVAAVGPYMDGTSLLYVLDQKTERLAVYEARGGAPNSRRVAFVGARNISLDTLLNGFNDESEYTHEELKREFEDTGFRFEQDGTEKDGTGEDD